MYTHFFGFKERPFQLVPNPGYLFLSKSHEEAMAHLKYAISHGDGFVQITGEVGTGKTTLCRAFLEGLDKDFEVAYIFNPQLDSLELLRAINDEFGIDSKAGSAKDLIDTLNGFLMEKKSQGKKVALLIDEAQNMNREALEQLRLLSNLETNTSKLLQIILVGQPELQKMLDSYDLRQLRQRITLSWYLTPLDREDTREYIRSRVNIASKKTEDVFSPLAYRRIYRYSGGIPRLINIGCDRALLTAFGYNKRKVTGRIAAKSIDELNTRGAAPRPFIWRNRWALGILSLALPLITLMWVFHYPPFFNIDYKTGTGSSQHEMKTTAGTPELEIKKRGNFEEFLGTLESRPSRLNAVNAVISRWGVTPKVSPESNNIDDNGAFFRFASAQNNLLVHAVKKEWGVVERLNLPAALEFSAPGSKAPCFLALIQITKGEIILKNGEKGEVVRVNPGVMRSYWTGYAYVLWKNFYNYTGDIPLDSPVESIFTLKMLLRDIGHKDIKPDYVYDDGVKRIVEEIQAKHGIEADGIVGARTKIIIYNEKKDLNIPHIVSMGDTRDDKSK